MIVSNCCGGAHSLLLGIGMPKSSNFSSNLGGVKRIRGGNFRLTVGTAPVRNSFA